MGNKKTFGDKMFNTMMAVVTIVMGLAVGEALRTGAIALPFIGPVPIIGWGVLGVTIWGVIAGLMK